VTAAPELADVVVVAASIGHPGSVRARALAGGLVDRGHRVTVVCADGADHTHAVNPGLDVRRVKWADVVELAKRLRLKRTALGRPRVRGGSVELSLLRRVEARAAVPDVYASWIPFAIAEVRRAVGRDTVVFSTAPVSGHVVAAAARKGQPWIADLNDLWWGNPHRPAGAIRRAVDRVLERRTLTRARALTTVNEVLAQELRRRYQLPVHALLNGFDPAEFTEASAPLIAGPVELLYAGTVYPGFDLGPLFGALRRGLDEGSLTPSTLRVRFVGGGSHRAALEATERGVAGFVDATEAIPRRDLLPQLGRAHALLLPLYENDPYSLPSRFFEYVGAGRPIIALGPSARLTARIVVEQGLGVVASTEESVYALLLRMIVDSDSLPAPALVVRRGFTWEHSVDELSALIESVR